MSSASSISDLSTASGGLAGAGANYHSLDFKLQVKNKVSYQQKENFFPAIFHFPFLFSVSMAFLLQIDSVKAGTEMTLHLVAPTKQEKAAWITDITQCMDNVHFDNLYNTSTLSAGAAVVPQFVKSDPSLFTDDVDIR